MCKETFSWFRGANWKKIGRRTLGKYLGFLTYWYRFFSSTQIVDEKSKIHAPKILRTLILPPNEPPKSANFAVSTRTHMGGTKQDP